MSYYLYLTYEEGQVDDVIDLATCSLEKAQCLTKEVIRCADRGHSHERTARANQATLLRVDQRLQVDLTALRTELHEEWQRDMEARCTSPEALAAERAVYERLKAKYEPYSIRPAREQTDSKEEQHNDRSD